MKPLNRLWEQVDTAKQVSNSDAELFLTLLKLGEFVTKTAVLATIGALPKSKERVSYRYYYELVKADGLGTWGKSLDQILNTAQSLNLISQFKVVKSELQLATNVSGLDWSHSAVQNIYECKSVIGGEVSQIPAKVCLLDWFRKFTEIRNDQAHNRIASQKYAQIVRPLEASLHLICNNFSLFKMPWFYLHRSSSGGVTFIDITSDPEINKKELIGKYPDVINAEGIYFLVEDVPVKMELMFTDISLTDFFLPNGKFTDKRYEIISYLTGASDSRESTSFLIPPESLPKSETHGLETLEKINNCFTNIPILNRSYVKRRVIEDKLFEALKDDKKWRIVTLKGRGGIGKTSTTLEVLHSLTETDRFDAIIWFSARDIDFNSSGPITVEAQVLTKKDIAKEYLELIEHPERKDKKFDQSEYFSNELSNSFFGRTLFVFDNFETVEHPIQMFEWLDNFVFAPNKALITTRHREFTSDKQIEVEGMNREEFNELVENVSNELRIGHLMDHKYKDQLFRLSQGHPYVIKILLGELANSGKLANFRRVFEDKDQILQALFERTYEKLSPLAQRIFLVLCSWRSIMPEIAIEAVIICNQNENEELESNDVSGAINDLRILSFIEMINPLDEDRFINVPLTASIYGIGKLKANPNKAQIQADTKLLQEFGAAQLIQVNDGIKPRIKFFFSNVAERVSKDRQALERYLPMMEFIARRFNRAWVYLADLYFTLDNKERTIYCLQQYLGNEVNDGSKASIWDRLSQLYLDRGNIQFYHQAQIDKCEYAGCSLYEICGVSKDLSLNIKKKLLKNIRADIKQEMLNRLIRMIENHREFKNATAFHLSRLSWLYVHIGQATKALKIARQGLAIEKDHPACKDIVDNFVRISSLNDRI